MERFYCVQAKPGREALAFDQVNLQRFKTFRPMYEARQVIDGDVFIKLRPMFPGYFFVRFNVDRDRWVPINYTRGVKGLIITGEGRPVPVADTAIYELMCRVGTRGAVCFDELSAAVSRFFEEGSMVKIIDGPWAGHVGPVERMWTDRDRIDVLLSVFGRPMTISMKDNMLEVAA